MRANPRGPFTRCLCVCLSVCACSCSFLSSKLTFFFLGFAQHTCTRMHACALLSPVSCKVAETFALMKQAAAGEADACELVRSSGHAELQELLLSGAVEERMAKVAQLDACVTVIDALNFHSTFRDTRCVRKEEGDRERGETIGSDKDSLTHTRTRTHTHTCTRTHAHASKTHMNSCVSACTQLITAVQGWCVMLSQSGLRATSER